ncbi:hypothetical protein KBW71_24650 [Hydrogenophaga aromaticivorans]|uniref:hypothetical protein n=1 Tax=Hydrogenophaga aromaticivorans TaxID=2610898 RepID=UPI001B36857B|nr:hypothetical protein [Hydrogenophaga aromaticivorans]MBQ0921635.1 hypothetical protein [Hydrogenophaga aromaticivorans]
MRHSYATPSPLDFRRLCADLLCADFSAHFKSFATLCDGAIDLRCPTPERVVISQARQYQDRTALICRMRKKRDDLDAAQEPLNNCHIAGTAVVGTAMARGYLARHLAARDAYQKHTLRDTVAGDQARYRLSRYKLCSE